jgi:hypothetical protein
MSDIERPATRSKSNNLLCWNVILLAILCGAAPAACRSAPRNASATGNLAMTMYVRDATGAESYYEVHRDGTLGFGGGLQARLFQTTWSGPMTAEEIAQIRAALEAQNWFRQPPRSTNQPADHIYRITIDAPERQKQFRVKGDTQALRPLHEIFSRIALRRLEPVLRGLPEPSIRQSTSQPATAPGS